MKLNVLSDLHLSKAELDPPETDADLVVLAGDLARPDAAMEWARQLRKPAIFVPGNHEFYGGSLASTVNRLRALAEGSSIRVLSDDEVVIEGVRFLGSTLWTDFMLFGSGKAPAAMAQAQRLMHDFSRIRADDEAGRIFTPQDAASRFALHSAWLDGRLDEPFDGPTVVITHHAPSALSVDPRFSDSLLSACFASSADDLLQHGRAALWIHGHMHHSVRYRLHGVRVVCNPRGYVVNGAPENPHFDPRLVVEI